MTNSDNAATPPEEFAERFTRVRVPVEGRDAIAEDAPADEDGPRSD